MKIEEYVLLKAFADYVADNNYRLFYDSEAPKQMYFDICSKSEELLWGIVLKNTSSLIRITIHGKTRDESVIYVEGASDAYQKAFEIQGRLPFLEIKKGRLYVPSDL